MIFLDSSLTTRDVLEAIGNPYWVDLDELDDTLHKSDLLACTGEEVSGNDDGCNHRYIADRQGSECLEIYHPFAANDFIHITVKYR
jgi:hypothetical protein